VREFPRNSGVTLTPDRVPERPWWTRGSEECWGLPVLYRRSDGETVEALPEEALRELEHLDQRKPLLEPRFRPGQVWLLEAAQTCVTATLDIVIGPFSPSPGFRTSLPDPYDSLGTPLYAKPPLRPPLLGMPPEPYVTDGLNMGQQFGFVLLGRYLPQREGIALLRSQDPEWNAYLIWDPCNPLGGFWTGAR